MHRVCECARGKRNAARTPFWHTPRSPLRFDGRVAVNGLAARFPDHRKYAAAHRNGERLRFVARFDGTSARVGLCALPPEHPLCAGGGTDNRVAIASCRYAARPLVIQGPGAGAEVTAAALLDDALACMAAGSGYDVADFGAGSAAR